MPRRPDAGELENLRQFTRNLGISRSTVFRRLKEGDPDFPQPIQQKPRSKLQWLAEHTPIVLVPDDYRPECWLKVDYRSGEASWGDTSRERIQLTGGGPLAVSVGSFRHGYIVMDAEGRPGERHMVAMGSGQPRPQPPDGCYARFGEEGPRQALEVGFNFVMDRHFPDDPPPKFHRPNLTFTTSSMNATKSLRRLLDVILAQMQSAAGRAGYIYPEIEIRPGSFLNPKGDRVWFFDWRLTDWLAAGGATVRRQSDDRRFGAELAVHYDPPAPSVPQFKEVAEQLEANGWQGVPELGASRIPARKGWLKARPAKVWLRAVRGQWRVLYTGLLTATTPALDIDVTDPDLANEFEALALELLGLGLPRIGRAPKRMLFYRSAKPLIPASLELRKGEERHLVEILGSGRKATAIAPHQKTGLPYQWPHGSPLEVPVSDLPAITRDDVLEYLAAASELARQQGWDIRQSWVYRCTDDDDDATDDEGWRRGAPPEGYGEADADIVASALERIPNNDLPYDDWIKVGLAIRHGLGRRAGEPLWLWWSGTSRKFNRRTTLKTWHAKSFEPRRITVHFLYSIALWGWRP